MALCGTGSTTTLSGIGVGISEADVFSTYPGRIRSEPHPYGGGNYLICTPQGASDQAYSMIFETDRYQVTSFRAGEKEAVGYIEGCL